MEGDLASKLSRLSRLICSGRTLDQGTLNIILRSAISNLHSLIHYRKKDRITDSPQNVAKATK